MKKPTAPVLNVIIPGVRIRSTLNLREHWRARAARAKKQKADMAMVLSAWPSAGRYHLGCGRLRVTMTRIYPPKGRALDDDNLAGGFKAVRDAIAKWLGVDDADPRVAWSCAQRRGDTYAVEIVAGKVVTG